MSDSVGGGADSHAADILAVLDVLRLSNFRYWGYSMGEWIGFALAKKAPGRITSMVLGGADPLATPSAASDPLLELLGGGAAALLPIYGGFMTPQKEARLLSSDVKALIAYRRSRLLFALSASGIRNGGMTNWTTALSNAEPSARR